MDSMTEDEWREQVQRGCPQIRDVRGGSNCQQGPITRFCTFEECPRRA